MTRKSKLEELNLLDEAQKLHEEGYGLQKIGTILMESHPDAKEKGLTHMSIKRGLEVFERNKIQNQMAQGLNPVDEMNKEFKEKMDKNTDKLASIEKKANEILDEAMESDSIADKTKALKEVRDTLGQIAKNTLSLQQYYQMKVNGLQKEAFEQHQQVKDFLVKMIVVVQENVCPQCKERTIPKIMSLVESEGE